MDPPTKHQKSIPDKLVFHIYNKKYSHLITAIMKLVAGYFFFVMRSCDYSATPKGGHKQTRILWKGDIKFYRKRHELPHSSGCLHLGVKVSPTFRTQINGVENATVTQWWTGKHLCLVQVFSDIVTRLYLCPGSS